MGAARPRSAKAGWERSSSRAAPIASFDKLVAVKFVHAELLSPLLRERFAAERQALAALEHPGIARLLDGGESASGEPYLVLEYVEGRSLLAFATEKDLSRRERLELFLQILAAVAHAHSHLIVHRDIKPSNILVTANGEAKLLDFGVAKILTPIDGPEGATRTSLRALTPEYASPEQVLGGATTTATDVYSLGVVLFELPDRPPSLPRADRRARGVGGGRAAPGGRASAGAQGRSRRDRAQGAAQVAGRALRHRRRLRRRPAPTSRRPAGRRAARQPRLPRGEVRRAPSRRARRDRAGARSPGDHGHCRRGADARRTRPRDCRGRDRAQRGGVSRRALPERRSGANPRREAHRARDPRRRAPSGSNATSLRNRWSRRSS